MIIPIGQAREDRGKGVPLTDEERLYRHFEQTGEWDLPERGTGLTGIGQGDVGVSFWSSLKGFVSAYPWQTAMVLVAVIAIAVNIRSTRTLVKTLQLKGR